MKKSIEFSENYDQEDDTFYVSFQAGEPSYCVELDDILLLEMGMFTKLPTGFRILNFTKNKEKILRFVEDHLAKKMKDTITEHAPPTFQQREDRVERALEKVLA